MKSSPYQRHNHAFTLIELLVVIAIIAILAAILFPVFAQAREKARQASCLSNMKQISLGLLQYVQDYDETFPVGHVDGGSTGWTNVGWTVAVEPYIKSLGVFYCPSDEQAGGVAPGPDPVTEAWAGRLISYAANGYYGSWCCDPTWDTGFSLRGPMGVAGQPGWLDKEKNGAAPLAAMTRPADTILLAEKFSGKTTFWAKNSSGFSPNLLIMGDYLSPQSGVTGWGDQRLPDGTRNKNAAYPDGPNGAVTPHNTGMANFAFVDGHVKAMKPEQTNPDPVNKPSQNLWDGLRQ